jgi:hypothetical protein
MTLNQITLNITSNRNLNRDPAKDFKVKEIKMRILKYSAIVVLLLLTSMIFAPTLNPASAQTEEPPFPNFPPTQEQARVIITTTVGGTTEPAPGQYTYPNQTKFEIKAIPDDGYRFAYWSVSGQYLPGHNMPPVFIPSGNQTFIPSLQQEAINVEYDSLITTQNPLDVVHGYGYTFQYQAIFVRAEPVTTAVGGSVVVLNSVGGATIPQAGTYTYSTDAIVTLTATPDSGFQFDHWIISGGPLPGHGTIENSVISDNPLETHSVSGYSYNYQPVFTPVGTETQPSGIPAYIYAAIIILVIIAVIGIAAALMYRSRGKK